MTNTWLKDNLFPIIGVLMVLANLWLAYQIAPTANKVLVTETRLGAVEAAVATSIPRTEVESRLKNIEDWLSRIEHKVDELLTRPAVQIMPLDDF